MIEFNTSGDGHWSEARKTVEIVDMTVPYVNDERDFGELKVYFNTDTWDVDKDGLIYTDRMFLADLQEFLVQHNLPGSDVSYSEQGMQGEDYVSLDVGSDFINAWEAKFGVLTV